MVAEHAFAAHRRPRLDDAGRPWLDQNWGAQLALYGIWRLGGFPLLTVASTRSSRSPPGDWSRPPAAGGPPTRS
jgi:hypothetical protein